MSAAARAGAAAPPVPTRRQHNTAIAGLLISSIALAIVFLPTSLILAIGMVPTFIAMLVERDADHTAPLAVGALNFAGVMPFILTLWRNGQTVDNALKLMTDPINWAVMYGAAIGGWAIFFLLPPIIATMGVFRAEHRIREIEGYLRRMEKDWGPAVAGKNAVPKAAPARTPKEAHA